MTNISASPKKLRDGSWGAVTKTSNVEAGDVVTITTRAGKTWNAKISRVIWTGDDVAIVATMKVDAVQCAPRARRDEYRAVNHCSECGERIQHWHDGAKLGLCHDCL